MAGWQDDPVVAPASSGSAQPWQNDPVVDSSKAAPAANPDLDYSNSPLSAIGRTFESSADWGTGDLLRAVATGKKPSETAAQSSAAAESLPWYIRYPTEGVGYGLGLVNLLDPVTDAAEAGALGLGASAKLAKLAGTAAEGGTVGGTHYVASTDDPTVGGALASAAGGAALNTAAGAVLPTANKVLSGVLGKKGTFDPDAVVAATKADTQQAFGTLKQTVVPHDNADYAIGSVVDGNNLSASQKTGMKSMMPDINDIRQEIADRKVQGIPITGDDLNSWARQVKGAASTDIQGGVANDIAARLKGAVGAQGGGGAWDAAQAAARRQAAAESLKDYGQTLAQGGSLGQAPLNEAKKYYPDPIADKAQYDAMAGLTGQAGQDSWAPYALKHLVSEGLAFGGEHIGETLGGGVGGVTGALLGELLGLSARPAIGRAFKGRTTAKRMGGLQSTYPTLTGQQPTGGRTGPQIPQTVGPSFPMGNRMVGPLNVGDAIKSAIMGSVY